MTGLEVALSILLAATLGGVAGYVLRLLEQRRNEVHPDRFKRFYRRSIAHAGGKIHHAIMCIDSVLDEKNYHRATDVVCEAVYAQMRLERMIWSGRPEILTEVDRAIAHQIVDVWVESMSFSNLSHGTRLMRMLPECDADGNWTWWTPPAYVEHLRNNDAGQQAIQH